MDNPASVTHHPSGGTNNDGFVTNTNGFNNLINHPRRRRLSASSLLSRLFRLSALSSLARWSALHIGWIFLGLSWCKIGIKIPLLVQAFLSAREARTSDAQLQNWELERLVVNAGYAVCTRIPGSNSLCMYSSKETSRRTATNVVVNGYLSKTEGKVAPVCRPQVELQMTTRPHWVWSLESTSLGQDWSQGENRSRMYHCRAKSTQKNTWSVVQQHSRPAAELWRKKTSTTTHGKNCGKNKLELNLLQDKSR